MTRKKKSPVSNVNRKGIIPINAWMNYLQQQIKGTSLLINKEDSSDEEIEDEQYGAEEENECLTSQENQSNNQEKIDTALDDSKESDDGSYEEDDMFSDEDYEGFRFVQDVTCNMNAKAGIPDS